MEKSQTNATHVIINSVRRVELLGEKVDLQVVSRAEAHKVIGACDREHRSTCNIQFPISGYSVQNSWESFMCVPTSKKDTSVKDSEVGEVGGGGDGEDVEHQLGGQGNGHLFDQR